MPTMPKLQRIQFAHIVHLLLLGSAQLSWREANHDPSSQSNIVSDAVCWWSRCLAETGQLGLKCSVRGKISQYQCAVAQFEFPGKFGRLEFPVKLGKLDRYPDTVGFLLTFSLSALLVQVSGGRLVRRITAADLPSTISSRARGIAPTSPTIGDHVIDRKSNATSTNNCSTNGDSSSCEVTNGGREDARGATRLGIERLYDSGRSWERSSSDHSSEGSHPSTQESPYSIYDVRHYMDEDAIARESSPQHHVIAFHQVTESTDFAASLTTPEMHLFDEHHAKISAGIRQNLYTSSEAERKEEEHMADASTPTDEDNALDESAHYERRPNGTGEVKLEYNQRLEVSYNGSSGPNSVRGDITVDNGTHLDFESKYLQKEFSHELNATTILPPEETTTKMINELQTINESSTPMVPYQSNVNNPPNNQTLQDQSPEGAVDMLLILPTTTESPSHNTEPANETLSASSAEHGNNRSHLVSSYDNSVDIDITTVSPGDENSTIFPSTMKLRSSRLNKTNHESTTTEVPDSTSTLFSEVDSTTNVETTTDDVLTSKRPMWVPQSWSTMTTTAGPDTMTTVSPSQVPTRTHNGRMLGSGQSRDNATNSVDGVTRLTIVSGTATKIPRIVYTVRPNLRSNSTTAGTVNDNFRPRPMTTMLQTPEPPTTEAPEQNTVFPFISKSSFEGPKFQGRQRTSTTTKSLVGDMLTSQNTNDTINTQRTEHVYKQPHSSSSFNSSTETTGSSEDFTQKVPTPLANEGSSKSPSENIISVDKPFPSRVVIGTTQKPTDSITNNEGNDISKVYNPVNSSNRGSIKYTNNNSNLTRNNTINSFSIPPTASVWTLATLKGPSNESRRTSQPSIRNSTENGALTENSEDDEDDTMFIRIPTVEKPSPFSTKRPLESTANKTSTITQFTSAGDTNLRTAAEDGTDFSLHYTSLNKVSAFPSTILPSTGPRDLDSNRTHLQPLTEDITPEEVTSAEPTTTEDPDTTTLLPSIPTRNPFTLSIATTNIPISTIDYALSSATAPDYEPSDTSTTNIPTTVEYTTNIPTTTDYISTENKSLSNATFDNSLSSATVIPDQTKSDNANETFTSVPISEVFGMFTNKTSAAFTTNQPAFTTNQPAFTTNQPFPDADEIHASSEDQQEGQQSEEEKSPLGADTQKEENQLTEDGGTKPPRDWGQQPVEGGDSPVLPVQDVHDVNNDLGKPEANKTIPDESFKPIKGWKTTISPKNKTKDMWTTSSPVIQTTVDSTHGLIPVNPENVPYYLILSVDSSWYDVCRLGDTFKEAVARLLTKATDSLVKSQQVVLLNIGPDLCTDAMTEGMEGAKDKTTNLSIQFYIADKDGKFNMGLCEVFSMVWRKYHFEYPYTIRSVQLISMEPPKVLDMDEPSEGNMIAVISLSCVGGLCLIIAIVIIVLLWKRQTKKKNFKFGERCTPVTLDDYSMDSVSAFNSVRRKGGMRASKRSYGNPAFDNPNSPSHPMNFAGLANFSSDSAALEEEFGMISQVTPKVDELPEGAEAKNRYANVIPLPETRVKLSSVEGDTLSDYINANYVRGPKDVEKFYIACQAPLQSTITDFWRMVWEQQTRVILMLTDLVEDGKEKCADYLPPSEVTDCHRLFGDFQVTLKKREVKENYVISSLQIKNMETNTWREVTHLWYLGWPPQGVPEEANSLIAFLIEARSYVKSHSGPTVVHCSPGTGRTGTVMSCDLCIREFEQTRMVDIPRCVSRLRRDRAGAVQTKEQYAFIYQVMSCDLCIREFEQTRMVDIPRCVSRLRRDRAGAVQTKEQYAFIYQVR
uniref:protein-tyrosine-phosphatase n=1 Tax=Timema bartmani TaxID=61472 RepID=A0A7R9ENN1_9NEOP|nr:unnamed protein product [Timema bartmani]